MSRTQSRDYESGKTYLLYAQKEFLSNEYKSLEKIFQPFNLVRFFGVIYPSLSSTVNSFLLVTSMSDHNTAL